MNLEVPTGPKGLNFGGAMPPGFKDRDLSTEELDVLVQNAAPGKPLIISFGGHGQHHETGEAFYGWSKAIYEFPQYSHVTVRDTFGAWYFNGIRGVSTDIRSTIDYLRGVIDELDAPFVMCCGTSMGAYASILFGTQLGVDHVLALAPQTLLEDGVLCHGDGHIYKVYECVKDRPEEDIYRDLTNLSYDKTVVEIVFSEEDPVDNFQSKRFGSMPNVQYTYSAGVHGEVAKYWRDTGELSRKLSSFLGR